jgi:hypothetical protein
VHYCTGCQGTTRAPFVQAAIACGIDKGLLAAAGAAYHKTVVVDNIILKETALQLVQGLYVALARQVAHRQALVILGHLEESPAGRLLPAAKELSQKCAGPQGQRPLAPVCLLRM